MTTRVHGAVEYALPPLLTTLATNTTVGTATRHDFTATTVYIPETLVGATPFRSVYVVITVRTQFPSTARSLTGWRVGIKLGAVAFTDVDFVPNTITASGENYTVRLVADVTSYFNTNWTGTSMAAQVGLAIATSVADVVGNLTAKIVVGAYDYDDTSTTWVKTARIPIQSEHTTLTTTKTEIGTGGTAPAAANQIPALDTYLPESTKVIRRAWIEFMALDGTINNTDFNLFVEVDSAGEATRATLETGPISSIYFEDHFIYDTAAYSTASAHALSCRSSLAGRFQCIGAVLCVTYEYDRGASTRFLQSLLLPFEPISVLAGTTSADQNQIDVELWVEEPGTITLLQSGVVLWAATDTTAQDILVSSDGATYRNYAQVAVAQYGHGAIVHRTDADWALGRGRNVLTTYVYCDTQSSMGVAGGYALINYTSDEALGGEGSHNRSTAWFACSFPTTGTVNAVRDIAAASQRIPGGLQSVYFVNNYAQHRLMITGTTGSGPFIGITSYELLSGELRGDGWLDFTHWHSQSEEYGSRDYVWTLTDYVNRTDQQTGRMAIDGSRRYRTSAGPNGVNSYGAAVNWLTHHEIQFAAAGTITGYAGDGSGIVVDVWCEETGEKVASTTTNVGGGYQATLYDDTLTYYSEAREDGTHLGRSNNFTPDPA